MKTFKKSLILLLTAMVLASTAFAQSKNIAKKADDLFDQNRFIEALEKYESAYNKITSNKAEKNRIYFQMAECYRLMNDYPHAERIYKRLAAAGYSNNEPKLYFYLAEMCRFEEKFDEADQYYEEYLKIEPTDTYARSRKESLIYVNQLSNSRSRHIITKKSDWCTDYNDWAPRFLGTDTTKIVFTSSRFPEGEEAAHDAWTGQAFSELYTVFMDRNGRWSSTPQLFDKSGVINTAVNEGEACFSPDGNTVYFSRCDAKENEQLGCKIYVSVRVSKDLGDSKKGKKNNKNNKKNNDSEQSQTASGDWGEPTRIDLGDTNFNYLYPAISSDGLVLYFASDRPGGFGGYDLWKATRKSTADDFGRPINMTSIINTAGRELFPMLRDDSTLYFSSDGHPGVGGLDLFTSRLTPVGKWTVPQNLGIPMNSSYDEMSIIFYPVSESDHVLERGYFSSNRPFDDPHNRELRNQSKEKTPPINDDIFYFELPPLNYSIEGTVRDEKSMQLIEGVRVRLAGSDGSQAEARTDKKGFYRFDNRKIRRDVVYKLYLSKKDYFSLEGSESTRGYNVDKDIVHDFRMEPVPKQPVVLPEIRFDVSKADLKGEYMDSLMDLYLVMVNNPNIVVEIRSHTDCRPYIGLTNDTLSQRRAQTVVDYLVARGIERDRLVAKGYADRIPRVLDRETSVYVNGKRYTFSEGTEMDCDYINTLQGDHQEAAHSLNRRTEFLVLRTDYVSRRLIDNLPAEKPEVAQTEDGRIIDLVNRPADEEDVKPEIIHDESTVPVTMVNSAKGEITAIINGSQVPMLIDERYLEPIAISWEEAMNFLYQRRITKEDFPLRDQSFDPEGNILDKATIIFKEMQIGERHLKNAEVVVVKGVDYKFIINRTGLAQFGEYDFDKRRARLTFIDD